MVEASHLFKTKTWKGRTIVVKCIDGQVSLPLEKLNDCGRYFKDAFDESDETIVELDLGQGQMHVQCPQWAMERIIEFTELTANFTSVIAQPLRNKQSMLHITTPSIAKFADSFVDPDQLCHLILLANIFNN